MNIRKNRFIGVVALVIVALFSIATVAQEHNDSEHEHSESGHDTDSAHAEAHETTISAQAARQAGIEVSQAGPGVISQTVTAYGRLAVGPEQISHVRARFTGIIREVNATLGEQVEAGRQLAEIQSNESLSSYAITAPINGVVLERHANAGEITQDQVLFTIVDFDGLWAELQIFPRTQSGVQAGQPVHVLVNDHRIPATIDQLLPSLDRPYLTARISLANNPQPLMPGELVSAEIQIGSESKALVIPRQALQSMEGEDGVFIQSGEDYRFVPVEIGEQDSIHAEIVSGLQTGDTYVSGNSFLIKADIQKSQAEHSH
ncbi:efflux RND transporter periplasmic adaptor subunit [Pseudohongiella nitratireducens]|uniref:efflux RND transporter periplasmic adaptor subunit n=1 Tax=Pseudohongiella nitratireducens TaxID=1768907 RepID=UPI0030EF2E59|tara:strand:- start:476 stop:1426 length:951 start_codon:yes stop_codon:yes gene_type:complete